jgi:hypothetical protein
MISQTAPQGEPHFVLTMAEHTDMCGQMARAFGNDAFEQPAPFAEVVYMVANHDRGWDAYDANPGIDPNTNVPYIMARTPLTEAIKTSRGSPDFNAAHHPYCGLLSSMHSCGLYNGRYGLSNFIVSARNKPGAGFASHDAHQPLVDAMLAREQVRQAELKSVLLASPQTRPWIEEHHLFQNYKQLQFFDTLALYFQLRHAGERGEETYIHVPLNREDDTAVRLRKKNDRIYSLDPFPFAGDRLTLVCRGRYVRPFPADFPPDHVGAALRDLPSDQQTYELVPE